MTHIPSSIPQLSQKAADQLDAVKPTENDLHYIAGWISSSAPDVMLDAIDAMLRFRERRIDNIRKITEEPQDG